MKKTFLRQATINVDLILVIFLFIFPYILSGQRVILPSINPHSGGVKYTQFSHDSKYLVTASEDHTIKIRELPTGQLIGALEGHTDVVNSVAFSPDGKYLASASDDNSAIIWDFLQQRLMFRLESSGSIEYVEFSAGGRYLLTGSFSMWSSGGVTLWDVATGNEHRKVAGYADSVQDAGFSPDGSKVFVSLLDGRVFIWDTEAGDELHRLEGHNESVISVAFSEDGQYLLTASNDKTVKLWDMSTVEVVRSLKHERYLEDVIFSPDGDYMITIAENIRIWETGTGQLKQTLKGSYAQVTNDGRYLVLFELGDIEVWELGSGVKIMELDGDFASIESFSMSSDEKYIALADESENEVELWKVDLDEIRSDRKKPDTDIPKIIPQVGHLGTIRDLSFSPNDELLASVSEDGLKIWDLPTGLLRNSIPLKDEVYTIEFDTDSTLLVLQETGLLVKYNAVDATRIFWANLQLPSSTYDLSNSYLMQVVPEYNAVMVISKDYENDYVVQERSLDKGELVNVVQSGLQWLVGFGIRDNLVYYSDNEGNILRYDLVTKELEKAFKLKAVSTPVRVAVAENRLVTFQDDGFFYVYELDGSLENKTRVIYNEKFFYRRDHPMIIRDEGFMVGLEVDEIDSTNNFTQMPRKVTRLIGSNFRGEPVNIQLGDEAYFGSPDAMALSRNGQLVAVANDADVFVIDLIQKKQSKAFRNNIQQIKQIRFISQSHLLVNTFVSDSKLEIWDLSNGTIELFPNLPKESEFIDYNETADIYALSHGIEITFLDGSLNQIDDMFITDDLQYLYGDSYIQPAGYYPVKFGHDGKSIVTQDGKICGIKLWSYPEKELLKKIRVADDDQIIEHLDYSSQLGMAIVETSNNYVGNYKSRIFNLENGKKIYEGDFNYSFKSQFIPGTDLAIVPDGLFNVRNRKVTPVFTDDFWMKNGKVFVDPDGNTYFLSGGIHYLDTKTNTFSKVVTTEGEDFAIMNNRAVVFEREGRVKIYDIESDSLIATIFSEDYLNQKSFLIYTADNYFMNSLYGLNTIAYGWQGQLYNYDQFDMIYNRPDIVLSRLGFASDELMKTYQYAYEKRPAYSRNANLTGFKEIQVTISNRDEIPFFSTEPLVTLNLTALGKRTAITSYQVRNNGVVIEDAPFSIPNKNQSWQFDATLLAGRNILEVMVIAEDGQASLSSSITITRDTEKEKPSLYFIGIGVEDYEVDAMDLSYPAKDIDDLAFHFDQSTYFREVQFLTLKDRSFSKGSLDEIKKFIDQAGAEDLLAVFYSGHGILDNEGNFYLSTSWSTYDDPGQNSIPIELMEDILSQSRTLKRIFFIDACHSGLLDREDFAFTEDSISNSNVVATRRGAQVISSGDGLDDAFEIMQSRFINLDRGSGTHVIAAAAGDQFAFEDANLKNGLFTYSLLEILRNARGDENKSSFLSVNEIRSQLEEKVLELSDGKQKPASRRLNYHFDFDFWSVEDSDHNQFHHAVINKQYQKISDFVNRGIDVNIKDPDDGMTALHYAAREDEYFLVEYLIGKGARLNVQSNLGWTPLHLAAFNGHLQLCELLVYHGADDQIRDKAKLVPVESARQKGHDGIVEFFSNKEEYLRDFSFFHAIRNGDWELFKTLIDEVDVNAFEKGNIYKPIHWAAQNNLARMVEELIRNGAEVNVYDRSGYVTPMYLAITNNAYTSAVELYRHGAPINRSELDYAKFQDGQGTLSPKIGAFLNNRDSVVQVYEEITEFLNAIENGELEKLKALLDQSGKQVNQIRTMEFGYNLLMSAIIFRNEMIAEYMIDAGCDVNIIAENNVTPLLLAIGQQSPSMVELLLTNGAKQEYNEAFKTDPLSYARQQGNREIVQLLEDYK